MFWDELDNRLSVIEDRLDNSDRWGKKQEETYHDLRDRVERLEFFLEKNKDANKEDDTALTIAVTLDNGLWRTIVLQEISDTVIVRWVSQGRFDSSSEALDYGNHFRSKDVRFIKTDNYQRF